MQVVIICGVSGCGKSTIGAALSERISARFVEGDAHHPDANIEKMTSGQALTDVDRTAWLDSICTDLDINAHKINVLACSALTPYVQDYLSDKLGDRLVWIKLGISKRAAKERMKAREHFMPPELMDSQFEAWQAPKGGLEISAEKSVDAIVDGICLYLEGLTDS